MNFLEKLILFNILFSPQFGIKIGNDDRQNSKEHHHRTGGCQSDFAAMERHLGHEYCWHVRRGPWPPCSKRNHQIITLDGYVQQNHDRTHKNGTHHWQDDGDVDTGKTGAVDFCSFDDFVIDGTKTCKKQGHHKSGRLPDRGNHDGINRHVPIDQPVEGEFGKSPVSKKFLNPQSRIEHPFPSGSGDNE